ncbi:cobalt ECF transporter T component CbiQ [Aceticella autotrophica]|uniref:Cobalt ECF transporter T component CbiQ n=1 Tax=Aceticella autotrophica TaxID=2755338 RepID=A0A975AVS9_9THEO|nr:cobalt ECF transporter T component CbiQ [Aceticella autotrophica]QSZ27336.1 cobalt ECF transporter T component CbiQ [Aceticella autotrophica]
MIIIRKGFIEKTIENIDTAFKQMFFSSATADKNGLLQKISPKYKVLSAIIFVVISQLIRNVHILLFIYLYLLLLAYLSKLSPFSLIKRVLMIAGFISGIVLIPCIFNIVVPGTPIFSITKNFYITSEGVTDAFRILMHTILSITIIFLFTSTSRWNELLSSLKSLYVPKIFVMVIEMAYRYVYLLLKITLDMFLSRKSRTIGKLDLETKKKVLNNTLSNMLLKTLYITDEAYKAMLSRGYIGKPKFLNRYKKVEKMDIIWGIINSVFMIIIFWGDKFFGK